MFNKFIKIAKYLFLNLPIYIYVYMRYMTVSKKMYIQYSLYRILQSGIRVMVFNAPFNNISVISWRSLTNLMLYRIHLSLALFELTTLVVICTDCTGYCKSNYHTITTTPHTVSHKNHIIKINVTNSKKNTLPS